MRYHLFRKKRYFHFELPVIDLLIRFNWKDLLPRSSRAYFVFVIGRGSFMFLLYRPGALLPSHTDGPTSVPTVAIDLIRPKRGRLNLSTGKQWWRFAYFDGATPHSVTECSGHRLSLLFQWVSEK